MWKKNSKISVFFLKPNFETNQWTWPATVSPPCRIVRSLVRNLKEWARNNYTTMLEVKWHVHCCSVVSRYGLFPFRKKPSCVSSVCETWHHLNVKVNRNHPLKWEPPIGCYWAPQMKVIIQAEIKWTQMGSDFCHSTFNATLRWFCWFKHS